MAGTPFLLLGTSISGAPGDAARREAAAQASLAALQPAGIDAVNLAFLDEAPVERVPRQIRVLSLDGPRVSGRAGPRKPVISEMLDRLAAEASARGIRRIGLVNGDIIVLSEAVARLVSLDAPAVAISRTDAGGGAPEANQLYGVDMFVFDLTFWRRRRRRFRDYLLGERVWDNVYASIVSCHGGRLLNRERLILHDRHAAAPENSPYSHYVQRLAARDRSYFRVWCGYVAHAEALRARGGTAEEEYALQRAMFRPPGPVGEALDAGRAAWWRARQALGA